MKQLLKRITVVVMVLALCFTSISLSTRVSADTWKTFEIENFKFKLFFDEDGDPSSLFLTGYTGNETNLVLPTHIIYNKQKLPVQEIQSEAFAGNTKIKKVIIPVGYSYIGPRIFDGCTGLTEIVIGDGVEYISESALTGTRNLKTIRLGKTTGPEEVYTVSGIGTNEKEQPIKGVKAYVVKGSAADKDIQQINTDRPEAPIQLIYETDPAKEARVTKVLGQNNNNNNNNKEPKNPYSKGASYNRADKAIKKYSSEKDVPGSVYGLLQLKQKKVKKNAIKVTWKKVSGAKKYAYYATNCGVKYKYVKHGVTTKTSINYKKIKGKKLKKGKYYKFIVIAIDKNNKVISTSKTVHIATKGGKVTNDKRVKTKVKKNKKTIKVKKTFKIKAKEVKPKKGKVKRHRKIKYESLNTKVATVNAKGVVKGVAKGKTTVFAYAQNGVSAKVKVTVK